MSKTDTQEVATVATEAPSTQSIIAVAESQRVAMALATRQVGGALRTMSPAILDLAQTRGMAKRLFKAGQTVRAQLVRDLIPTSQANAEGEADARLADAAAMAQRLKPGCSSADRARYRISLKLALAALV